MTRTAVVRSRRDAAFALGVAVPAALLGAVLWRSGRTVLGAVSAVFAGLLVLLAAFGTYRAQCPACSRWLHHLLASGNGYVRCGWCGRYAVGDGAAMLSLADDHVADDPEFAVAVDAGAVLPRLCVVCAAASDHDESVGLLVREAPASKVSTAADNRELSVSVPHCSRHSGGARLTRENLAPMAGFTREAATAGNPLDLRTVLKVRSYRFYLEATRPA